MNEHHQPYGKVLHGPLSKSSSPDRGELESVGREIRQNVKHTIAYGGELQKRELTPDQKEELFTSLELRLEDESAYRPENISFNAVEKALDANPALTWSLFQLDQAGGEPDIIAIENGAFVFADCSEEAPEGHRLMNYDEACNMAKELGVELMNEEIYSKMQKRGKFDLKTWGWLTTSPEIRETGYAISGHRGMSGFRKLVTIIKRPFNQADRNIGWRGVLRIPMAN
jgi:hypothetical protein